MQLLKGETVTVIRTYKTYEDGYPVVKEATDIVENALVHPGITSDLNEGNRPDGVTVAFTVGFPKTYQQDLRGAFVVIDGRRYSVVGDPQPCCENCPTAWNRNVEVSAVEG